MKKLFLSMVVMLAAQISFGCSASFTTSSAPTGSTLLRYEFTNTSTYGASGSYTDSSVIDYGDGTSIAIDRTSTVYHTYSSPGTYTVTLRIITYDSSTSSYCSDTATSSLTVSYPPCGSEITSTVGLYGTDTLKFSVPSGSSVSYSWDFDDGSTSTSSSSPLVHTYSTDGRYTVSLTTTGTGCTYTNSVNVRMTTTANGNCIGNSASFGGSTSYMTFYGSNTSSTNGLYDSSMYWYFGDGTSAMDTIGVSHTYSTPGTYPVKMIVKWTDPITGNVKCADSAFDTVTVVAFPNTISGYIFQDSTTATSDPVYKVWLITYDSSTHIIAAVDSLVDSGSMYSPTYYKFDGVSSGDYLIKAAVTNGPTSGTGFVPTYYTSSTSWSSASYVHYTSGMTTGINITMQSGTVTSGPGFIAGNVLYGAGKLTGSGTPGSPVEGMLIMLKDSHGKLIANTRTDASGNYKIRNLPYGTYEIYPEELGYTTTPWGSIDITYSKTSATDINFKRTSTSILPVPTSIANIPNVQNFDVFPNPTSGKVILQLSNSSVKDGMVSVTNIAGQRVYQTTINTDNGRSELNLSSLESGLYFINVTTNSGSCTKKITIQH